MEYLSLLLFVVAIAVLLMGYPVAFSLGGTGLFFAFIGIALGIFDFSFLEAIPSRFYSIMTNEVLLAIPLFIFMGTVLEKSKLADELLETMGLLFGPIRGGLAISVALVGMLLAASTGIVGAAVVTMGLLSLPTMIKRNYDHRMATGIICASGTLGQIIPPSIVLILLGDVISAAYQKAQLELGNFSSTAVSVGDLFLGAIFPGLLLVFLYIVYIIIAVFFGVKMPPIPKAERQQIPPKVLWLKVFNVLLPPILLIFLVLGSILLGVATPTEAAGVGCVGALIISGFKKRLSLKMIKETAYNTSFQTTMVFFILLGASIFSLVFRGFGGDDLVRDLLLDLKGGVLVTFIIIMLLMFILGFFLDFIEITFVVVPIVAPILILQGFDPVWLGVLIALNLQTSFLTPPFGFSLFYLRGVTDKSIKTSSMYYGVIPFIAIQIIVILIVYFYPELATWLPESIYGR